MSALDDARREVERLEKVGQLEQQLADAGQAHEQNPSEDTLAEHNRVAEQLAAARAEGRSAGGHRVGGDTTIVTNADVDGTAQHNAVDGAVDVTKE